MPGWRSFHSPPWCAQLQLPEWNSARQELAQKTLRIAPEKKSRFEADVEIPRRVRGCMTKKSADKLRG
jgi:hypothetical protein